MLCRRMDRRSGVINGVGLVFCSLWGRYVRGLAKESNGGSDIIVKFENLFLVGRHRCRLCEAGRSKLDFPERRY